MTDSEAKTFSLVIDISLVTMNKYINAERNSRFKAAAIKKQQTNAVMYIAMSQRFCLPDGMFNVHFEWHKPNNREDHDNIRFPSKFILDGIVKSKAVENDSPRFINNFTDDFVLDKSRDYVWCIVTFAKVE